MVVFLESTISEIDFELDTDISVIETLKRIV